MPPIRTDAVVCRTGSYSETSQTVTLFTRSSGLVHGLAKGARRPRSAFGGPFDAMRVYEVIFLTGRGTGLRLVTQAELLETLEGLRGRLDAYRAACFVTDVLLKTVAEEDPDADLYGVFAGTLHALCRPDLADTRPLMLAFAITALARAGLGFAFGTCAACGTDATGRERVCYAPDAGFLCENCASGSDAIPVAAGTLRVMAALAATDFDTLAHVKPHPAALREAAEIVAAACRFLLEKPPALLKYLN